MIPGFLALITLGLATIASEQQQGTTLRVWYTPGRTWLGGETRAIQDLLGEEGLLARWDEGARTWYLPYEVPVAALVSYFDAHIEGGVDVYEGRIEGPVPPEQPWRERPVYALHGLIVFASGTNTVGEIRGTVEAGHPVGAAADRCHEPCVQEFMRLAGTGIPVFLDSGAFGEMDLDQDPPVVAKLMTPEVWEKILVKYERLAAALGPQLYVVAPDRVGDQEVTLERLARYRDRLVGLANEGANVLVPLQKGAMDLVQFHDTVFDVLRPRGAETLVENWWIPAMPMKKDATSLEDLTFFLSNRPGDAIHYLGLGYKNSRTAKVLAITNELNPGASISMDSVRLTALTIRAEKKPRILARAKDYYTEELLEHRWGSPPPGATLGPESTTGPILDYTDVVGDLGAYLSRAQLYAIGRQAGLAEGPQIKAWVNAPNVFWGDHPELAPALDEAVDAWWVKQYKKMITPEMKRRAVRDVFRTEPGANFPPAIVPPEPLPDVAVSLEVLCADDFGGRDAASTEHFKDTIERQLVAKELIDGSGLAAVVDVLDTTDRDSQHSDAYVRFNLRDIRQISALLDKAGLPGDILDVPPGTVEPELIDWIRRTFLWDVEDGR